MSEFSKLNICKCISEGMSNKNIADKFDVSVNTVQHYKSKITQQNYVSTMPKRTRLQKSDHPQHSDSLQKSELGHSYCDLENGTSEEPDQFYITGTAFF